MKKKIKSNTLYRINTVLKGLSNNETETRKHKHSYSEYTEGGQLTLDIRYNEDGEVDEKYINKYDSKGRLLEETTYLGEHDVAEHKTYERNENGLIICSYKHYQDGEKDTIHYNRDAAGNLTEKITIDSYKEEEARELIDYKDDKATQRKVYEYDELMLEESYNYDPDGNMTSHSKWSIEYEDLRFLNEFDSNGNIIKALRHNLKGDLVSKISYTYEKDKLVHIREENQQTETTTTLTYDEKDNPIEQVEVNKKGDTNNRALRTYNENGDVIESEVFINHQGKSANQHYVIQYEYTYYD